MLFLFYGYDILFLEVIHTKLLYVSHSLLLSVTNTMAKSPDAVANRSTPEYLAFRKCYRSVRIHITPQIEDIHDALFEKGYIPPSVQDYAATDAIPKEMKARSLVDTVIKKIELDPEVFHGFVSILKNEGPSADSIVEQLGEVFKAEQALVYCDHSSEDSYHSLSGTDSSVEGTMKMSDPQKMSKSVEHMYLNKPGTNWMQVSMIIISLLYRFQ